jgi:hypothetical protein
LVICRINTRHFARTQITVTICSRPLRSESACRRSRSVQSHNAQRISAEVNARPSRQTRPSRAIMGPRFREVSGRYAPHTPFPPAPRVAHLWDRSTPEKGCCYRVGEGTATCGWRRVLAVVTTPIVCRRCLPTHRRRVMYLRCEGAVRASRRVPRHAMERCLGP